MWYNIYKKQQTFQKNNIFLKIDLTALLISLQKFNFLDDSLREVSSGSSTTNISGHDLSFFEDVSASLSDEISESGESDRSEHVDAGEDEGRGVGDVLACDVVAGVSSSRGVRILCG